MATWQERMAQRARDAAWQATFSGACGWCTDEGDDLRRPVFEWSRLDGLTVARSGYLGEYAKAHANSKDLKKQLEVADFLASPEAARSAGVEIKPDVEKRQLGKAEFFARRDLGAAQLMESEGLDRERAEKEWMMREAEHEVSERYGRTIDRSHPNPFYREEVRKAYRKRCRKDWGTATKTLPA